VRGHETITSPIDGGASGYRSECDTCGTVLRCHATLAEAERHAERHTTELYVIEAFFVGGTTHAIDNKRNVLALRLAKQLGPIEYERVRGMVYERRKAWRVRTTLVQRRWQASESRRPQRGRHHDSWSIREKYVRCA
jgi:hypothetical protein